TPTGRVSAFNTAVTVVHDGQKTTRTLQDAGDLARLLASDFGLAVAPDMLATAAARIGLSPIASTLSSEAVSATEWTRRDPARRIRSSCPARKPRPPCPDLISLRFPSKTSRWKKPPPSWSGWRRRLPNTTGTIMARTRR